MDAETKKKYLASDGVRCPYCGSEDLTGGPVEIDAGIAMQDIVCDSCEKTWTDVYGAGNWCGLYRMKD